MATVTLPTLFVPRTCDLRLSVNQRVRASPFGGSESVVDLLNDRWLLSCELNPVRTDDGAWREAFIGAMRGQTNVVGLHHFARKQPRGTLRGTLLINTAAAQGASSIVIKGGSPATGTLLAGDMIGVGGLLLMVASDAVASAGVITVPIINRLRVAQLVDSPVTWDKPTAPFRLLNTSGVQYVPGLANPITFDFGEKI